MRAPATVRPAVRTAIYDLVRQIPPGKVASYGMIASLIEGVTARMVGHALRGASESDDIPWHRVINASGMVSAHDGSARQRTLLQAEGIELSSTGRVRWREVGWSGPQGAWLERTGMDPIRLAEVMAAWPR